MPMARLPLGRCASSHHRTRGLVGTQTTIGRGLIAYRRDKADLETAEAEYGLRRQKLAQRHSMRPPVGDGDDHIKGSRGLRG
jgi:hypothetical protein